MTTYRLPDALGGGECRIRPFPGQPNGSTYVRVEVGEGDEMFTVDLLRALLVKVEPPLPTEPPNLTVLRAGTAVYQRDDNAPATSVAAGQWWMAGRMQSTDWASIAHLQFEVLAPAPEPVEPTRLPYEFRIDATGSAAPLFVKVDPDCSRRVRFGFYSTISRSVSPAQAREIGRAFLTAANEVTP